MKMIYVVRSHSPIVLQAALKQSQHESDRNIKTITKMQIVDYFINFSIFINL